MSAGIFSTTLLAENRHPESSHASALTVSVPSDPRPQPGVKNAGHICAFFTRVSRFLAQRSLSADRPTAQIAPGRAPEKKMKVGKWAC
jgi:hypothetical protein